MRQGLANPMWREIAPDLFPPRLHQDAFHQPALFDGRARREQAAHVGGAEVVVPQECRTVGVHRGTTDYNFANAASA